jgi:hypothetical protein
MGWKSTRNISRDEAIRLIQQKFNPPNYLTK